MLHHPPTAAASARVVAPKKRGSYNCGRCGLPKKGHVCPSADGGSASLHLPRSGNRLRRALSFDEDRPSSSPVPALEDEDEGVIESAALVTVEEPEVVVEEGGGEEEDDEAGWDGEGSLPSSCMVEILRRLSPKELMRAAAVCRGWRECVRKVWRSAEELRLRVSPRSQIGIVGSVLQKCAGLTRLALRMESDVDATMLACVAFSLPNLEAFEINMAENAVNRITGDELGRFVAEKRCLSTLKVEGCTNIGFLNGVQFAAVQLPLLQLIDCGMSICDTDNQNESAEKNVLNEFAAAVKDHLPCKRLADGSKRVQVPHFVQQLSDDEKQKRKRMTQCIVHQD
ncbi:F-box LRR-repeat protein [Musa troglodytarum]|uniref:F-box LRR-repeat protein n=1 Tax=Musa troglodytarum TaxID=320322 RepID=A0A9E7F838_9LILI|nr:F-box LRR-repeat protein [Musa troglodytarum]